MRPVGRLKKLIGRRTGNLSGLGLAPAPACDQALAPRPPDSFRSGLRPWSTGLGARESRCEATLFGGSDLYSPPAPTDQANCCQKLFFCRPADLLAPS